MIRLRIQPEPTPHEAQAIEAAITSLVARPRLGAKTLRFNTIVARVDSSDDRIGQPQHTWPEVARIEALEPGV